MIKAHKLVIKVCYDFLHWISLKNDWGQHARKIPLVLAPGVISISNGSFLTFKAHLCNPYASYCFQLEAMDHQIAEEMGKLEELENGENKM